MFSENAVQMQDSYAIMCDTAMLRYTIRDNPFIIINVTS
jgi:hypothetical protein